MLLEIIWDQETTSIDLADGTVRVGGSPSDDIHLTGLPHGLVKLTIEGERVTVTSIRSVRIGAALFPARVPRLLMAGEDLKLPNDVVIRRAVDPRWREARKAVETVAVVKELLAGGLGPEQTRAAILTCVTGTDQGTIFPVAFEVSIIGREDGADIRIRDRAVSRRHASLRRDARRYLLSDLSATNGVYLNGLRVRGQRALKSGDVIELGQTLLRFDGPERAPGELTKAGAAEVPSGAAVSSEAPTDEVARPPGALLATAAPDAKEEWPAPAPKTARRGPLAVALITVGAVFALVGTAVTALMFR